MKLSLLLLLAVSTGSSVLQVSEAQTESEPVEDLAVYFVNDTPIIDVDRRRLFAQFEINRADIDFQITCGIATLNIREDCSSGQYELRDFPPGLYTFRVVARDLTNKERTVTRTRIVLHPDASLCSLVLRNRGVIVNGNSATFFFAGVGATSQFFCGLDQSKPTECSSPFTIDDLAAGDHRLKIIPRGSCGRRNRPTAVRFQIQ